MKYFRLLLMTKVDWHRHIRKHIMVKLCCGAFAVRVKRSSVSRDVKRVRHGSYSTRLSSDDWDWRDELSVQCCNACGRHCWLTSPHSLSYATRDAHVSTFARLTGAPRHTRRRRDVSRQRMSPDATARHITPVDACLSVCPPTSEEKVAGRSPSHRRPWFGRDSDP